MKRIVLTVIFFISLIGLTRAQASIDRLFEKYAHRDGFTTVNISGKLLSSSSKMKEADVLSKIKSIRILTVEDKELNKKLNFYKELEADGFFKHNNMEPLMEVTEKDEVVRFYGKTDENGSLSDLLLIVGGDDNTLISIKGIINLKDIGAITSSLNLDGHKK